MNVKTKYRLTLRFYLKTLRFLPDRLRLRLPLLLLAEPLRLRLRLRLRDRDTRQKMKKIVQQVRLEKKNNHVKGTSYKKSLHYPIDSWVSRCDYGFYFCFSPNHFGFDYHFDFGFATEKLDRKRHDLSI